MMRIIRFSMAVGFSITKFIQSDSSDERIACKIGIYTYKSCGRASAVAELRHYVP